MNRALLTLGLVLMDVCWVYPWSALAGLWSDPPRPTGLLWAPSILVLILLAATTTHFLGRRLGRGRGARLVLGAITLVAATLAVRFEHYAGASGVDWIGPFLQALAGTIGQLSEPVLAFALALYLWWRGVRLGSQTPGFADVEGAFRWGIGRLAVFGLVMALSTRRSDLPTVEGLTTPYVVGFFFVSLLTLALGRLESLRTRTRRPTFNTQWLGVLVLVAGGVVFVALLFGQLLSFDVLLQASAPLLDLLGLVLMLLVYAIVIPLSFVIEWIIYLLLALVQANGNRPPPQPPAPADVDNLLQRFFAEQVPPELLAALKAAGVGLVVVVALLIVARGLTHWRPSSADADATNEERDSLWSTRRAWALLLEALRRLLRRRRLAPAGKPAEAALAADDTALADADTIRALYGRLLRQGESVGAVRGVATTPSEHEPALAGALEPEGVIGDITDAFVRVRYGDAQVPAEETAALRDELDRVQAKGAGE